MTMPEELKGYKCPDKEDCSECEFHNTKCIVYSAAGRKKYELWRKQQIYERDCKVGVCMNFNNCVKKKIFKKSGIYKNKKTRNECKVLFTGINTTNAQDGQEMVCYIGNGKIFFREINEFFEKFE